MRNQQYGPCLETHQKIRCTKSIRGYQSQWCTLMGLHVRSFFETLGRKTYFETETRSIPNMRYSNEICIRADGKEFKQKICKRRSQGFIRVNQKKAEESQGTSERKEPHVLPDLCRSAWFACDQASMGQESDAGNTWGSLNRWCKNRKSPHDYNYINSVEVYWKGCWCLISERCHTLLILLGILEGNMTKALPDLCTIVLPLKRLTATHQLKCNAPIYRRSNEPHSKSLGLLRLCHDPKLFRASSAVFQEVNNHWNRQILSLLAVRLMMDLQARRTLRIIALCHRCVLWYTISISCQTFWLVVKFCSISWGEIDCACCTI